MSTSQSLNLRDIVIDTTYLPIEGEQGSRTSLPSLQSYFHATYLESGRYSITVGKDSGQQTISSALVTNLVLHRRDENDKMYILQGRLENGKPFFMEINIKLYPTENISEFSHDIITD